MKRCLLLFVLVCGFTVAKAQNTLITAMEAYDEAVAEAKLGHGDNVRLQLVYSAEINMAGTTLTVDPLTGKAMWWAYSFYSPDDDSFSEVAAIEYPGVGRLVMELVSTPATPLDDTTGMYGDWVDSDVASTAMRGVGLQAYADARPGARGIGMVLSDVDGLMNPMWVGIMTDDADTLQCMVDAVTLAEIQCRVLNALDEFQSARDFRIAATYPNPVRGGAVPSIDLSVDRPASIRVLVYDVMGRQLGVVADKRFEAGVATLLIPTDILPASGMVFIAAESSSGISTRKLLIAR